MQPGPSSSRPTTERNRSCSPVTRARCGPPTEDRMPLLTIDAGNTNTVLGVFDGTELRVHWRLTTRREQTADEYAILVRSLFASSGIDPASVDGIILASVVPPLTPVLVGLSRQLVGHDPIVIEPGVRTGMPVLYDPPGDVGADRIVNG